MGGTDTFEMVRQTMVRMGGALERRPQTVVAGTAAGRLEAEIRELSQAARGQVGVAALHLETGRGFSLNADETFPMASTFKLALAVTLLRRVAAGQASLDELISFDQRDLVPPPVLETYFRHPGLAVSVANLLDLMIITSDNAATDAILRVAGGVPAVQGVVAELGISGMRVDRSTDRFLADFLDVPLGPDERFAAWFALQSPARRGELYAATEVANEDYERDPRDSTTPVAMVELLRQIWTGDALRQPERERLLSAMHACENRGRLAGLLPPGTPLAHKTGTLGGSTSDVGVIALPHGGGHLAAAVYVKLSRASTAMREAAIAQIARALYDYMLFAADT